MFSCRFDSEAAPPRRLEAAHRREARRRQLREGHERLAGRGGGRRSARKRKQKTKRAKNIYNTRKTQKTTNTTDKTKNQKKHKEWRPRGHKGTKT